MLNVLQHHRSCPETVTNFSLSRVKFKQEISGKGLKMGHQNIRGIEANLDLFEEFLRSHNELDIIALSETHIRNNTITNHLNIERYFFWVEIDRYGIYYRYNADLEVKLILLNHCNAVSSNY